MTRADWRLPPGVISHRTWRLFETSMRAIMFCPSTGTDGVKVTDLTDMVGTWSIRSLRTASMASRVIGISILLQLEKPRRQSSKYGGAGGISLGVFGHRLPGTLYLVFLDLAMKILDRFNQWSVTVGIIIGKALVIVLAEAVFDQRLGLGIVGW